ncbi:MAG: tRNA lysidine(34) synthetase TilS [Candidatus Omnitrophica bacterium]|nr:tRNA lysidine(34) synthetase TilS [Candidatus Omnitrophota bacterium]MDD5430127.1 tRNA lysidine(34) synthetase TilS [Candidatus Omnitrophota bacterium]
MRMIEDIFKITLEEYSLLKKKDKLLLGISGGPDSLFLLHHFLKIKKEYKLQIVCAHFNHNLRKEADQEESFVKKACFKLGVKCLSDKKDVASFCRGDSLEQTARDLRFDFFLKCSRQTGIKKIALAHHKDDLAETVLMRMIRGSGLRGLRGFLPKSRYKALTVIRPLIKISKEDIINWLKDEKVSYCIDKSNFQEEFFRNRIRLKLLPLLKTLNPSIIDSLCNMAGVVSVDYNFIYNFSYDKFLQLKRRQTHNSIYLSLEELEGLEASIFNNVIRIAIEELQGHTRRLEAKHLEEIYSLVSKRPTGSIVDLPSVLVKKEAKCLLIQSLIL